MDYGRSYAAEQPLIHEPAAEPEQEWHPESELERATLSKSPHRADDGPEFSSEPMPAAFAACLFMGAGLVVCLAIALFW
jgi:hypothetical protein